MDNESYSWLKLRYHRVRLIIIYYCLLLVMGLTIATLVLLQNCYLRIFNTNYIFASALLGAIGISAVGSSTYYIRKLYKLCISKQIQEPGESDLDLLQQMGVTVYFVIRPIFAIGFSILVVIGLSTGLLTISLNSTNLSQGFVYVTMFISFFAGFSSGQLLEILEKYGSKILKKLFNEGEKE